MSGIALPRRLDGIRVGTCGGGPAPRGDPPALGFLELTWTSHRPPNLATAQRWRAAMPDDFQFTLRIPRAMTRHGFKASPITHRGWKQVVELAGALDAKFIVFPSPAGFRPTDETIADLIRFFEWAHRDRLCLGWEPRSEAWSADVVRDLCRELSLTHVVDPFEREPARGRPPYYRLRGIDGPGHRYTDEELSQLRDFCGTERPMCDCDRGYCVFTNASAVEDGRRFAALLG